MKWVAQYQTQHGKYKGIWQNIRAGRLFDTKQECFEANFIRNERARSKSGYTYQISPVFTAPKPVAVCLYPEEPVVQKFVMVDSDEPLPPLSKDRSPYGQGEAARTHACSCQTCRRK
jgi:hypothetical protein